MRLIDADNYKGKVIASHCYSGVNKLISIDDVPTVDVNNLIIDELEKIKLEITEYRREHNCGVMECLDIIDKEIKAARRNRWRKGE